MSSSFKKLPTYQPVLLTGTKPAIVNRQPQNQYQQQSQQPPTQNYTVHTVMPQSHHYHHTPQTNQHHTQKTNYFTQHQQQSKIIDSINVNMKTFPQQQGLMSLIPQAQKPLPLYVPFERRKWVIDLLLFGFPSRLNLNFQKLKNWWFFYYIYFVYLIRLA